MNGIDPRAFPWLEANAHPKHWAELYFKGRRYGHLTSNISESLNSWLLKARKMPLLPMLEMIRHQLMEWFKERRTLEDRTAGLIVSKMAKELQATINARARRYRFYVCTDSIYEVESKETRQNYCVDLSARFCSCRQWTRTGLPCGHVCAVILGRKEDPQSYVDEYFTLAKYKATYRNPIFPPAGAAELELEGEEFNWREYVDEALQSDVENQDQDSDDELLPPSTRRPAGRPKKKRIRRTVEDEIPTRTFKCSRCKGEGHSRRTCRAAI